MLGQRLMVVHGQQQGKIQVNLQGVEPGLYLVRVVTENGVSTKQIVKQ